MYIAAKSVLPRECEAKEKGTALTGEVFKTAVPTKAEQWLTGSLCFGQD